MAHFAKLDNNNIVVEVHVVSNEVLDSSNEELSGIEFLTSWSGGYSNWKQTSYNGTFRKNYAGIGFYYDIEKDAFIPPQPFPSWILNEQTCLWTAPIPRPEDGYLYVWDENILNWKRLQIEVSE